MSLFRTFIAIDLPSEVKQSLQQITHQLKEAGIGPIHWVDVNAIHITLKFLGDLSQEELAQVTRLFEQEVPRYSQFHLHVSGIGAFPNADRPRILWAGVQTSSTMYSLKKGLEQSLFELGFDRDNRPFSPHITMGRVRRDTKQKENEYITQALSNFQKFDGGMFHVGSVHIFQSQLKPTGAVHTIYKTATLTKVKI